MQDFNFLNSNPSVNTPAGDHPDMLALHRSHMSNYAGSAAPGNPVAYMPWADTAQNLLMRRNGANTAWIVSGRLDTPTGGYQQRRERGADAFTSLKVRTSAGENIAVSFKQATMAHHDGYSCVLAGSGTLTLDLTGTASTEGWYDLWLVMRSNGLVELTVTPQNFGKPSGPWIASVVVCPIYRTASAFVRFSQNGRRVVYEERRRLAGSGAPAGIATNTALNFIQYDLEGFVPDEAESVVIDYEFGAWSPASAAMDIWMFGMDPAVASTATLAQLALYGDDHRRILPIGESGSGRFQIFLERRVLQARVLQVQSATIEVGGYVLI